MEVIVKNNNVSKAYALLSHKLKKDGDPQRLKERRFYRSKSQKERDKHKYALIRIKKDNQKRDEAYEKYEQQMIIENKRQAKLRRIQKNMEKIH